MNEVTWEKLTSDFEALMDDVQEFLKTRYKRQDGIEKPHHNNCRYQNQKRSIHMITPFNQ